MSLNPIERKQLTILGGSSVSTPILLEEIGKAQSAGALAPMTVRLWGRCGERMVAIGDYMRYRLNELGHQPSELSVFRSTRLEEAVYDTDIILCQVRPGGMLSRALDEDLALSFGIPGDEGLGPSGLSCFLRTRDLIQELAQTCAEIAPRATLLMMTSPLGLNVAVARQAGANCYGVCELPAATIAKVRAAVEPLIGCGPLDVLHFGLNHQGWLHCFRDQAGADWTEEVLDALNDDELVAVDTHVIRSEGAIPLPYLRLYYHTEPEVRRQRQVPRRGRVLEEWAARAHSAYVQSSIPNYAALDAILAERRLDWYREGVLPAMVALLGEEVSTVSLNLPHVAADEYQGHVVELPCAVSRSQVTPLDVPPLPDGPTQLLRQLVSFEQGALRLHQDSYVSDIASVLALHPLVKNDEIATRIATAIRVQTHISGAATRRPLHR